MPLQAETRRGVVEMRDRLVADLGCQVDGGTLALLADVQGALPAIDAAEADGREVEPAERAVVTDDGETIRLAAYRGNIAVAEVELSPRRAITLAGELIAAAARRLG